MAGRNLFVDLAPFRASRAFTRLWVGNSVAGIGSQMTIVAVGFHIYDLTHSTLAVSLVALYSLLPMIVAGLLGGMLADAHDRRTVALWSAVVAWLCVGGLAVVAWGGLDLLWPLYLLTTVNAVASTILSAARSAIMPRLLPADLLPAAAALNGIGMGVMVTVGPALAGVLVSSVGFGWTYSVDVVLFTVAFLGILTLPPIVPDGTAEAPGWRSLREGASFLRHAPNVRMTFLLDIIAMTFGFPRVLYPALGAILMGGGAVTAGILTAAFACGALLSSVFSGPLGSVRWQGRAIGRALTVYGICILGFGTVVLTMALGWWGPTGTVGEARVAPIMWGCLFLAGAGAADNVSSVFRTTILQSAVPDAMRGRLQGLFIVVVTGGPRVGDLYVGLLATTALLWLPPLLGGVMIVLLVAILMRTVGSFARYDAQAPTP
ncbi:MFS transporter [Klugiella xanthotipulae]|uniref:Transmembrane secretion effector n=1 Tax=Klugiella xanthotipulae TaxID=244735 RepID=A0A543HY38_9MICO|nr:MFS transporter [Klugiella xanthotipulae]TQM63267.1 transmembrane secretion effector [Klugiella xanthotipulae]